MFRTALTRTKDLSLEKYYAITRIGKVKNMVQRKQFTLFNPKDNAVVALSRLEQGSTFFIKKGEKTFKVTLKDTIPFGHKFAIEHIKKGDDVTKYGKPIGVATTEINRGEHVHIHNVVSKLLREKGREGD